MIGAFEHTLRPAIFCFIGFLLFVFTLFLLAPLPASAQSTCHLITTANASQVPAGYGIPFNVLTSAREMLIRASCASTSVTVDVGVGNNLHYIYKQGYQWRNNAWAQYTLTGSNAAADWIVGSGRATLTRTSNELAEPNWFVAYLCQQSPNWFVAYLCQWTGNQWKCGCRD